MRRNKKYSLFVKCVAEKNLSQAHKYLQQIVEGKLRNKIQKFAKEPLF